MRRKIVCIIAMCFVMLVCSANPKPLSKDVLGDEYSSAWFCGSKTDLDILVYGFSMVYLQPYDLNSSSVPAGYYVSFLNSPKIDLFHACVYYGIVIEVKEGSPMSKGYLLTRD